MITETYIQARAIVDTLLARHKHDPELLRMLADILAARVAEMPDSLS